MSYEESLHNFGAALADLLTAYAKRLAVDSGDPQRAGEIIQQIGDGTMRIAVVAELVPFSCRAVHVDPDGKLAGELFSLSDANKH